MADGLEDGGVGHLAPGNSRQDGDTVSVGQRRVETVEVPNVFVVDVDVHELAHAAVVAKELSAHARVVRLEGLNYRGDVSPVDLDGAFAVRVLPQDRGHLELNGHV